MVLLQLFIGYFKNFYFMKKLYQGLYKVAARRSFRDTGPYNEIHNILALLHNTNEISSE